MQLADPQFGLFASSSGKTDEEIDAYAKRGLIVKKTQKINGFADETRLFSLAIVASTISIDLYTNSQNPFCQCGN